MNQSDEDSALTPSEEAVLAAIVRGDTNFDIACARNTSARTVANQVASVLRKTGCASRFDLIRRFSEREEVAHELDEPTRATLTPSERAVLHLATQGYAYKHVGYELGLSPSAVVRRITSILRKLRVPSRRELLRLLGEPPCGSSPR